MQAIYLERLLSGLGRLSKAPRYVAAHTATGSRSDGASVWEEPESVWARGIHRPKRGKVADIRVTSEEYAEKFREIDAERVRLETALASLRREERELMDVAWASARPVTVAELKQPQTGSNDGN